MKTIPLTPRHLKFYLILVISFMIYSCSSTAPDQRDSEIEQLLIEKEALKKIVDSNQQNVDNYFSELNQIEENLRIIKQKEQIISSHTTGDLEMGAPQQKQIITDIKLIGELMEKNRILIASLNNRLRNSDTRIKGFEQSIERLNQSIVEKEVEIGLLRNQLASTSLQVDFLTARLDTMEWETREKTRRLEMQTIELNTAYFAMGSRKELSGNNIINREGGFLGLGKVERLNANFNLDYFTRIDIMRDREITIIGQKPELISAHPTDSYKISSIDGDNVLEILNPNTFWATTRYLVIQLK